MIALLCREHKLAGAVQLVDEYLEIGISVRFAVRL